MDKRARYDILKISLLVAFLSAVISFFTAEYIPVLKGVELKTIDLRFNYRGVVPNFADLSDVVIVSIDESSLDRAPDKWPWPRNYYARLLRNLKKAGARIVAFDINFDSPDRDPQSDREFRKAIEEFGNVVLAGRETRGVVMKGKIVETKNLLRNIFIGTPGSHPGIVEILRDHDGVCRRYLPVFSVGDTIFPSFGTAVLLLYYGLTIDSIYDLPPKNPFENGTFKFGSLEIPKFDDKTWLINFAGPAGSFKYISFIDVLDDKEFKTKDELEYGDINTFDNPDYGLLYDNVFKDKIVIVGSAVPEFKGELSDLLPSPFVKDESNLMYGVEIHANAISTVLEQKFIAKTSGFVSFLIIFIFSLLSFVLSIAVRHLKVRFEIIAEILGILSLFLLFAIWAYVTAFAFKVNLILPAISPVLGASVAYIGSVVYQYLTERKQKKIIKTIFSYYVHPSVVNQLISNPEVVRLGGEKREMTVLFTDLWNFTTISEAYPPEFIFNFLNEYFEVMTKVIFRYGGTLDKYIGDAIVAFWGAPIYYKDHALRACLCALKMQFELEKLRVKWEKEGKPLLYMRIGINTGEMIVGNIGGYGRFNYTVIGDSVNLGARLEAINKEFGTNIIISEYTYEKVKDYFNVREIGEITLKGKTKPVKIYELLDVLISEKKLIKIMD
ncbi:MAG: adenylate/guanylate cyclase domain-containing protein [Candidatus Kryptonium sp.]|nr:adenylate/guanylate cyclase domain-containing protein [Candidatus Kryptonium sp.]